MNKQLEDSHLDAPSLEAYRTRLLDPKALLAAADHLAECPQCRARAAVEAPAIGHLKQSLEPSHLSETELEAFAEDSLSDPTACEHLSECARCREDAYDLRRFVRTRKQMPASWWHLPTWPAAAWLGLSSAICAALFAGWYFPRVQQTAVRKPAALATAFLPDDWRQPLHKAVATGRLDIPPEVAALRGQRETQLGSSAPHLDVRLVGPLGTGTLTRRPEFRWQPVAGATGYQVAIFDSEFRQVAASGVLHDTHWAPAQNLEEGAVYVWELSIMVDGKRITAPRPPAPPAKFIVLKEADRIRLAELAVRYPLDHLLLGVIYANAGALDDARRELQAAQNQGRPEATKLLNTF
jgi:hypothetical protein